MSWNMWVRQLYRWLSITFTAGVLVYVVVMEWGQPAAWMGLLPLVPLILLLLSGLYLFVLPYAVGLRSGQIAGGTSSAARHD